MLVQSLCDLAGDGTRLRCAPAHVLFTYTSIYPCPRPFLPPRGDDDSKLDLRPQYTRSRGTAAELVNMFLDGTASLSLPSKRPISPDQIADTNKCCSLSPLCPSRRVYLSCGAEISLRTNSVGAFCITNRDDVFLCVGFGGERLRGCSRFLCARASRCMLMYEKHISSA